MTTRSEQKFVPPYDKWRERALCTDPEIFPTGYYPKDFDCLERGGGGGSKAYLR